ncbi:DUF2971 domain-containing protein [Mycobacterium sp. 050128]|uniref:DUF2971 domain-containing protein n=1 Tax=Mycobacterium sp. 050128 TaxID=3096112 RepID=UPI002EDA6230
MSDLAAERRRANPYVPMSLPAPVIEDDALPDEPLYHYTSAGGLHGILESEALWATHAAYLNDSQELIFGIAKVHATLSHFENNPPEEVMKDAYWAPYVPQETLPMSVAMSARSLSIRMQMALESVRENLGPFVACLSTSPDQLSQWRGYGQGGGYAIRFNPQRLRESVQSHNDTRRFVRMRYEKSDAEDPSLRAKLIEFMKSVSPMTPVGRQTAKSNALVDPHINSLLGVAACQKHWGFSEENEYRIVAFGTPDLHTPQDIGLVPRMNIRFDTSCVEEVQIGPGQHMDTRESSVRSYFKANDDRYPDVTVSRSETPFTGT